MMNPVEHAATEWITEVEKKKKLNKEARRAVISFAMWLDHMMSRQQESEDKENDETN